MALKLKPGQLIALQDLLPSDAWARFVAYIRKHHSLPPVGEGSGYFYRAIADDGTVIEIPLANPREESDATCP